MKKSQMERSARAAFMPQSYRSSTDPELESTSRKESKPQKQSDGKKVTEFMEHGATSPGSNATDQNHYKFTQMDIQDDQTLQKELTEFQVKNDQKIMTAGDLNFENFQNMDERKDDNYKIGEGIQNTSSNKIEYTESFQMHDTKVMVKTETKLGSSGTVPSSNFKFGMSGPVLEESLKLNPQADQGIPIYVKKRRQIANGQAHQNYEIVEEGQYQPMGEEDGSVYFLKRPSTIQEASNANMEETEGNEPSLIYNSIRNSQDAYPMGLYSYSQMSKPGTKQPSGIITPYTHGNQVLMTIENGRRSQPLENQKTLNSNVQSQRTLGGNDNILIQNMNHFRSMQDLNQHDQASNRRDKKFLRHSKSSGNSSTVNGGLVESRIHLNSSPSQMVEGLSPTFSDPILKVFCVISDQDNSDFEKDSQFFTTEDPSQFLLKQQVFGPQDKLIPQNLIKTLLKKQKDLESFVIGASSESNHQQDQLNLQMFEFDSCYQSDSFMDCLNCKTKNSFVILFGAESTNKSQKLPEMVYRACKNTKRQAQSLKISLLFQDQEIVVKDIPYKIKADNIKRHIENALVQKHKLSSGFETQQRDSQIVFKATTMVVQLGSSFFIDLPSIDGLDSSCAPAVTKCLNDLFGTITNGILMASPYYSDHNFVINQDQKTSKLFDIVSKRMSLSQEITFLTFVQGGADSGEGQLHSNIAVDFSHKIRSFFNGRADQCQVLREILSKVSEVRANQLKNDFQKVQMIFDKIRKIGIKVKREALQIHEAPVKIDQNSLDKARELLQKYDGLLTELFEFVCKKVIKDLTTSFDKDQLQRIQSQTQKDIQKIQEEIKSTINQMTQSQIQNTRAQNLNDKNSFKNLHGQQIFSTFGGEDKQSSVKRSLRGSSLPRYKSTHDLELENKIYKIDQNHLECLQSPLLSQSRSRSVNEAFNTRKNAFERSKMAGQNHSKSRKRLRKLKIPPKDMFVTRETKSTLLKQNLPFKTLQNLEKENPSGHRELMFHDNQNFVQEERRLTLERKSEPKIMRRAKSSNTKPVRMKALNMLADKQKQLIKKVRRKSARPKKRQSSFFNACSPAISSDSHLFKSLSAINEYEKDDVQNYLYKSSEQISENFQHQTKPQNNKLQDSYMRQSERSLLSASQTYQKYQVKENQEDMKASRSKCSLKFNIKRGRNFQNYSTSSQKLINKTFENLVEKRKNSQDIIGNYNQVIKPNIWKNYQQNIISQKSSERRTTKSLADFVELENKLQQKDFQVNLFNQKNQNQQLQNQLVEQLVSENKFLKESLQKAESDNIAKEQQIQMFQVQVKGLNKKFQKLQIKHQEFKQERQLKQNQNQNMKDVKFLRCQLQMALIQISQRDETNKKLQQELADAKKQFKLSQQKLQFTFDIREKSSQRQDRIGSLKEENLDLKKEVSSRDKQIQMQRGRVQTLTKQISLYQLQLAEFQNLPQKQKKAQKQDDQKDKLVQKMNQMKEIIIDLESQMDEKDSQIEALEMARDKFREQALDLKQEVKKIKGGVKAKSRNQTRISSSIGENSTGCPMSKFDELKLKQSLLRKDEVLRDIKSLMEDYNKPNNTIKLPSKECLLNSYKTHGQNRQIGASTENFQGVSQQHKRLAVFDSESYLIDQDL